MSEAAKNVIEHPAAQRGRSYSFEMTFALGRASNGTVLSQARIFTEFPQDIPAAELAARMDMLRQQARRQQAIFELEEDEQELENVEGELATHKENRDRAEADYQKKRAALTTRIDELQRTAGDVERTARQAHANSNRRGEFKPDTQTRQQINRADALVSKAREDRAKLKAERKEANDTLGINIAAAEKRLAKVKAKIERKRTLVADKG